MAADNPKYVTLDKETADAIEATRGRMHAFEAPYIHDLKHIGEAIGYGRSVQILEGLWDEKLEAQGLPPRFKSKGPTNRGSE